MNKPSERIVVFVTTAQKRAIAATAANLGISVSELMRRAVLSFGATSEQVKAASIVDRLRAPRAPDALDAALQRVARGTRHARAALPAALQTRGGGETGVATEGAATADAAAIPDAANVANAAGTPSNAHAVPRKPAAAEPAPLLPAGVAAALAAEIDEETVATTEAVARVAAAKAAATEGASPPQSDTEAQLRSVLKRPRVDSSRDDDDPRTDPSTEGGRFA
ncbi:hypothetical protein NDK50_11440 [Paraburkholderia bryophila]|uniref:hypothetical protein n=1 Tax=Paraburkholderia bryophila TaxID=420952 RepID=UPI00234AD6D0|nr:hypothetical protein [Paraburkholderia bryophila]WCM18097.1 hypothetical protein NDK50_11440 [Paraburkholderia bryophila]